MAADSLFCTQIWPPRRHVKTIYCAPRCQTENFAVASHADVLKGSSRVPSPRMSADLSGEKRRPITADFQIWEVHFGT